MVGKRQRQLAGGFIKQVWLAPDSSTGRYPFTLPVVGSLVRGAVIDLAPKVTFLVGDNGIGKSTLIEAIAVAAGFTKETGSSPTDRPAAELRCASSVPFGRIGIYRHSNAEGGSQSFRFATRASESSLGDHLVLSRGHPQPCTGYFLRAESFYNVATEIERLDEEPGGPPIIASYGGKSLHERSHGESFMALVMHRFGPGGLYLLDEPEAALSVRGCLALMRRITELINQGSQFIIATHSAILLATPGARILEISGDGAIEAVDYD
jgi:predicted ATPase